MTPLRAATIAISERLKEVSDLKPVDRALLAGQLASLALNAAASVDPEPRSLPAGRGKTAALTPTAGRDRPEEET